MIFGNAAWGFRETPLEEQFKITADMGLSELEIGIANAPNDIALHVKDSELDDIKALSQKYGVNMTCAATGDDFTLGSDDVPKVKRVIDICTILGVTNLRIFAGFTALEDMSADKFDTMIEAIGEVCSYAESKGVVPVIETHGGVRGFEDGVEHFASTTTDLETLKKMLSSLPQNARVCFDPANLYAVGENPVQFYEEIKDKVAYAHFKDFAKLPSGHIKPSFCGDSDMDWKAILDAMKDFEGVAVFEYENTEDITEGLKKSYDYICNI
ncbi:MAG: sugar phosphate isomerase/epimerase [Clostridia bacterium]|nr:sugar phosphate isomerase/epimerase [Clostridia bacterium]